MRICVTGMAFVLALGTLEPNVLDQVNSVTCEVLAVLILPWSATFPVIVPVEPASLHAKPNVW